MVEREKKARRRGLGPNSRAFSRGAISDVIDGRSREGRFLRKTEAELKAHLGASVSPVAQILIRRCAKVLLQLELLDSKMASGDWSEHNGKMYSALSNNLRLTLRELGIKAADPAPKSTVDYITSLAKGNAK